MTSKNLASLVEDMGKSESIKLTLGYLITFGRVYLDVKLERFTAILASYDAKSVKKLFKETKPYINKGIELFNKKFPMNPLITHIENNRLEDNATKIEINRMVNEEELTWSQIFAITTGTTNDSLSAHIIVADEAGLIDNQSFEVSISPFTTTTNAPISMFGLPTNNSASLLFQNYINKTAIVTRHTWEDIYKMRLLTDRKMAEGYKLDVTNRMKNNEKSSYIRWNYYCDFEDSNGKFTTRKLLQDNNVLTEEIEVPKNIKKEWLVMGVDISPKHDYFCITIAVTSFNEFGEQMNKIKYMKTLNKNREHKSMKNKCLDIVELCNRFEIDLLTVDSTSQQLYFIQELYNTLKSNNCKSQLFPYPYSGVGKEKLFGYLETMLYDQKLKLLKEDESWESKKLIEEMLYLKKEKKENRIFYGAPTGQDFSDDHINSLALCNIAYQYSFESSNNRKEFDDGEHIWRPKLQKYIHIEKIKREFPKSYMTVLG